MSLTLRCFGSSVFWKRWSLDTHQKVIFLALAGCVGDEETPTATLAGLRVSGTARIYAARASAGSSSSVIHDVAFAHVMTGSPSGVALDYGAGRAEFAARLVATGSFERVYAADLVVYEDPPPGVDWLEADLNDALPLPPESIDLIVAIEIVEHLENIRAVCREWGRLLRPGGRVVLTTPNNESVRSMLSLVFRGHFIAFVDQCYPAHITPVVRADIGRALQEAGLYPELYFFSDQGVIPRVTSVNWQQISRGRLRGLRFSDNVGCVAIKRLRPPL